MSSTTIVLNLKTYLEGTGINAVKIAQACKDVADDCNIDIAIAPQLCDIYRVSNEVDIPIYSQHIDPVGAGGYTGHVFARCVKDAGAIGTLINHSEKRLTLADIETGVQVAKKENLKTIICTNNIPTSAAAASLSPDYVAVEPPELIGSGIPVSKADPAVVTGSVDAILKVNPNVQVLCGAGISKGEDLEAALELGSVGVLLASGIVKAKNPKSALEDLVSKII